MFIKVQFTIFQSFFALLKSTIKRFFAPAICNIMQLVCLMILAVRINLCSEHIFPMISAPNLRLSSEHIFLMIFSADPPTDSLMGLEIMQTQLIMYLTPKRRPICKQQGNGVLGISFCCVFMLT